MAETRAVEDDHPVCSEQLLGYSTRVVVVPGHRVAVQQNDGTPGASITVVQPRTVYVEKGSGGRVPTLCQTGSGIVHERQHQEDRCDRQESGQPERQALGAIDDVHVGPLRDALLPARISVAGIGVDAPPSGLPVAECAPVANSGQTGSTSSAIISAHNACTTRLDTLTYQMQERGVCGQQRSWVAATLPPRYEVQTPAPLLRPSGFSRSSPHL